MSENTGTPAAEVAYENTADLVWTQRADDLYQSGQLQVRTFDTDGVVSAHAWGSCPRCGHTLDVRPTLSAAIPGLRQGLRDLGRWPSLLAGRSIPDGRGVPEAVEVKCGCDVVHPDAPDRSDSQGKVRGCGVSFPLSTAAVPAAASPCVPQESR